MGDQYIARGIRTSMKIEGLEELRQALRRLPGEVVQAKALSAGLSAGARVIRDEARKNVLPDLQPREGRPPDKRRTPGLVRRMLRATRGVARDWEVSAFVSVRRLSKKAISSWKRKSGKSSADNPLDPFYWSILEFGKTKRTARPFLRPAFDDKKEAAAMEVKNGLRQAVEKAAEKVRGRKLW